MSRFMGKLTSGALVDLIAERGTLSKDNLGQSVPTMSPFMTGGSASKARKGVPEVGASVAAFRLLEERATGRTSEDRAFEEAVSLRVLRIRQCRPQSFQVAFEPRGSLQELPTNIGFLVNLQVLDISMNSIIELPESFKELTQLVTLNISDNYLRELPDVFSRIPRLSRLHVARNELRSLPPSLFQLRKLIEIEASENNIAELAPISPSVVSDLSVISLNYNRAPRLLIPLSFFKLKRTFNLQVKKARFVVVEVDLRPDWKDRPEDRAFYVIMSLPRSLYTEACTVGVLQDFIAPSRLEGVSQSPHMRLLVVGNFEAGKTTLVRALTRTRGLVNKMVTSVKSYLPRHETFGIDVNYEWIPRCDAGLVPKFSVWDFAGQPEYHPSHLMFLDAQALYLIVFSVKEALMPDGLSASLAFIETWADMISSRAPGSKVLFVGTQTSCEQYRSGGAPVDAMKLHIRALVRRYKRRAHDSMATSSGSGKSINVVGVHYVDSYSDRASIKELELEVVRVARESLQAAPLIPTQILNSGDRVREIARSTFPPVMTLTEFGKLDLGFAGDPLLTARVLGGWGWVGFFENVAGLDGTVFLSPEWLAKTLGGVVSHLQGSLLVHDSRGQDRGVVSVADLRRAWQRMIPSADPTLLRKLSTVMTAFGVMIPVKDSEDTFVLPSLLDTPEPPPRAQEFFPELIKLKPTRFDLSLFPSGMFPLLVARLHSLEGFDTWAWHDSVICRLPSTLNIGETSDGTTFLVNRCGARSLELFCDESAGKHLFERVLMSLLSDVGHGAQLFRNGIFVDVADRQTEDPSSSLRAEPSAGRDSSEPIALNLRDIVVGKTLGSGSFGEVVKCSVKSLYAGNSFAFKRLRPGTNARSDPKGLEILTREFNVMRRLPNHLNVVQVLAASFEDDVHVSGLLLPLYDIDLRSVISRRVDKIARGEMAVWFELEDVTEWMRQVLEAVKFIHAQNVMHGDLKTEQFLCRLKGLDRVDTIVLCDFGCSAVLGEDGLVDLAAGTKNYLSPEVSAAVTAVSQGELPQRYDGRLADIYSLGMIASVFITGAEPNTSPDQLVRSRLRHNEPELLDSEEWAPLRSIATTSTSLNPSDRLPAASLLSKFYELGEDSDLKNDVDGAPLPRRRVGTMSAAGSSVATGMVSAMDHRRLRDRVLILEGENEMLRSQLGQAQDEIAALRKMLHEQELLIGSGKTPETPVARLSDSLG